MATVSMGKDVLLSKDALCRMGETKERNRQGGQQEPDAPMCASQVRDRLVAAIHEDVLSRGFRKVVVGISGGKDSTVTAALCARALGRENVLGVLMPNGAQLDIDDSHEVVDCLGIPSVTVDISPITEALVRSVPVRDVCAFGLDGRDGRWDDCKALLNVPPRIRMTVLRYICQATGSMLAGTSNLSERTVGYFTKDGDSSCDIAVLAGLTSVEVMAVGRTLDEIPRRLVEKPPADGLTGKTDEEVLGVSYEDIHKWIRQGGSGDSAVDERIDQLNRKSMHKRVPATPLVQV